MVSTFAFVRPLLLPFVLINMPSENNSSSSNKLRIQVQFWGGWGYLKYFNDLKDFLLEGIGGEKIEVVAMRDKAITGNFEVTATDGEVVLYSRKQLGGWQKMMTTAEKMIVMDMVNELLDE